MQTISFLTMIVSFAVSVSIKNNSLKKHLNFPTHAIKTKIYGFPVKIMIKYKHEENLYKILNMLYEHYKCNNKVTIDIDFNPNHF